MKKIKQSKQPVDSNTDQLLVLLEKLSDSEKILPKNTRFKFFKKLLLKVLRVHTAYQTLFNTTIINFLRQMIVSHESALDYIHAKLNRSRNETTYHSRYFYSHKDKLYLFQQGKFRGAYAEIKKRQQQYIPYLHTIRELSEKYPFLEVGFGRGEFLEILRESGIHTIIGLETNKSRVIESSKKGFNAIHVDAVDYLMQYQGGLSGLSAFHVVEHMSFEEIFDFLYIAHQKLIKNGLVIVETPNPQNIQVSSWSFYFDHTHKIKLPAEFLQSIFEYIGYSKVDIVYSSALKSNRKTDIQRLIYGPMDYAIVAYK